MFVLPRDPCDKVRRLPEGSIAQNKHFGDAISLKCTTTRPIDGKAAAIGIDSFIFQHPKHDHGGMKVQNGIFKKPLIELPCAMIYGFLMQSASQMGKEYKFK